MKIIGRFIGLNAYVGKSRSQGVREYEQMVHVIMIIKFILIPVLCIGMLWFDAMHQKLLISSSYITLLSKFFPITRRSFRFGTQNHVPEYRMSNTELRIMKDPFRYSTFIIRCSIFFFSLWWEPTVSTASSKFFPISRRSLRSGTLVRVPPVEMTMERGRKERRVTIISKTRLTTAPRGVQFGGVARYFSY